MKCVHKADMVAHLWAHQSQDTAYTASRKFSFSGNVLTSYSTPVGVITEGADGQPVVLLSNEKYSKTTARQLDAARDATRHLRRFLVPDIGIAGGWTRSARRWPGSDPQSWQPVHAANLAHMVAEYSAAVEKELRAVKWDWSGLDAVREWLGRKWRAMCDYADAFGVDVPALPLDADAARIWARCDRLNNCPKRKARIAAKAAQAERERAERETRLAVARAEAREKSKAAIREWLNGAPVSIPYEARTDENGGAMLRVRGDAVETSLGATVPVDHARRVLRFITREREKGIAVGDVSALWSRDVRTLGHFTLDRYDERGIRAGCHFIAWAEIERIAPQLHA